MSIRRIRFALPTALAALAIFGTYSVGHLSATSVIPISDAELLERAEVVVHGVVISSDVAEDAFGRPETVSLIEPIAVLKGSLRGDLVLHQLGGELPDGRAFQMWGRPEYVPGREVIVFAIARAAGDYETAEMMLGKFEVQSDEAGNRFAVPDLASGVIAGVHVWPRQEPSADSAFPVERIERESHAPRRLEAYLAALASGAWPDSLVGSPVGKLSALTHARDRAGRAIKPLWGNIGDSLWRWNNSATAVWSTSGTANMTGGGAAEAAGALATWTNNPNSTINYTGGTGSSNVIYLNAPTSTLGCGWSSCLSGAGVIGCGGPQSAGGSNNWRGDSYFTIGGGTVELRAYCTTNGFTSTITQSVLTHELGHTLGLGHSDQNFSAHDVCSGDEGLATMRATVQNRTTLGTDDQDAIRWIYGDGLNSCSGGSPAPTVSGINSTTGVTAGGTSVTISGSNFVSGATVSIGGTAATSVVVTAPGSITAVTGAHALGTVNVMVTNPDTQTGTLTNGFTYVTTAKTGDFSGDGSTDMIWRNVSTGSDVLWFFNGTAYTSGATLPTVADTNWRIVGAADFNRDGKNDLVWHNVATGATVFWYMNGPSQIGGATLPVVADTNWQIVATGDFNGDGKPDLVWRNGATGVSVVWFMNGSTQIGGATLPAVPDTNWQIVGAADFNSDSHIDLVWHNAATGANVIWYMNGASQIGGATLPTVADTNWQIVAVGDYNGDSMPDLVWRHAVSGSNVLWLMNGASQTGGATLMTVSDPNWRISAPR